MLNSKTVEFTVGLFMLAGLLALIVLAFKVSGLTHFAAQDTYTVSANFDNIGNLKLRAPVSIGGVKIGQVIGISLNPQTFKAKVTMKIDANENTIPTDLSASDILDPQACFYITEH